MTFLSTQNNTLKKLFNLINLFLDVLQEFGCVCSIHLCMVELERNGQGSSEPRTFVFAPNHKRIIENATIHTHCPINFLLCQCPGIDNHTLCREVVVNTIFRHLFREPQIVAIKLC